MHIAVLGGRFDPPHLGHLWVARQVKEYGKAIDSVFLVPANTHQWKKTEASPVQRLEMVKLLTGEGIEVSDVELERGGVSYTIDTIKTLKKETGAEISWVVGADILLEFDRWERKDELVKEARFLIFPRDPYHLPSAIPQGFEVLDNKNLFTSNLSSTIIKQRIAKGLSISEFVPSSVFDYIQKHNVYTQ